MALENTTTGVSTFYNDIKELINSITDPSKYNYERDFENSLKTLLSTKYKVKTEVKTMPLFDEVGEKTSWRIDLVVRINDLFIPIELKYRDEEQSTGSYATNYIRDIDKIKYLLMSYDDIPFGFAICLTNNDNLIKSCKILQLNQNVSEEKLLDPWHSTRIEWFNHAHSDYKFGIAGWRWAGTKNYCSRQNFKKYWDKN